MNQKEYELPKKLLRTLPKPVPAAGLWSYKFERWKALTLSPKKLLNYLKYKSSSKRSEQLNYLPLRLDIENVSRCNFRCTMCPVKDWPGFKRAEDMNFEDFKKLIDEQYGLLELKIQGLGEPTLGKDTYFSMINYARSKHIWVRTITNASLLHLHNNYKKLIDSGVNEVQISIDGATKGTFENIRRGSNFEKVTQNCTLINNYCKEKGVERTKMWTVVQKDNVDELSELVELSHKLGFNSMVFSLDLHGWGQEDLVEHAKEVNVEKKIEVCQAYDLIDKGQKLGVKVAFWNVTSKFDAENKKSLCHWPFEQAYISSDMRIVPCCMLGNPEIKDLGDAKNFMNGWNGKLYREFRKAHLEGNIPEVCKVCYKNQQK